MEHGKRIKIYEKLESDGRPTPLRDRPSVTYDNLWYFNAFTVLSNSRTGGVNGPNPISISEICSYYHNFGSIDPIVDFLQIIQKVDSGYLEFVNKKSESNTETQAPPNSRRKHGR